MKTIILLNAPPLAGKDTAANYLAANYNFTHLKFARILKSKTHSLYGFPYRDHGHYEDSKDQPHPDFLGLTPRQAYIKVSEIYFKPVHGIQIFGKLLHDYINSTVKNDRIVISDCGFYPEASYLIEKYGKNNVFLIKLTRPHCSFDNDSRNYIDLPVLTQTVTNDGEVSSFYFKLDHALFNINPQFTHAH